MEQRFEMLRIWAEALYDHQDVRIRSRSRIRNLIRRRLLDLGFRPEKKKDKNSVIEPEWTDQEIEQLLSEAKETGKLKKADYDFIIDSLELADKEVSIEKEYENRLSPLINKEPIWTEWLQYVNGISVRNSCRLLKYFGYCERFDTVSKLWAYAGLAVQNGKAVKRKKGEQLPYNLKIKTGCLGVIGDCLIRANGSYKKKVYDTYKKRIQERGCCDKPHPKHQNKMCRDYPAHSANMAQRKMIKVFLAHYWAMCRKIKNLPTKSPYSIDKLGHTTYLEPFYDKKSGNLMRSSHVGLETQEINASHPSIETQRTNASQKEFENL